MKKTKKAAQQNADTSFGNRGQNRPKTAANPYQVIDKRQPGTYGYNNTLIESAIQNQDRGAIQLVDYDFHRMVTSIGLRTLMSLGRSMFWRIPALQAAILEQANLTVMPFTPRFFGSDTDWGKMAFDWIQEWHQVCDLAGWPYDMNSYNETLIINQIVDGDPFTLLTTDDAGNPRIQMIASHRIGSRYQSVQTCNLKLKPVETAFGKGCEMWIDDILVDNAMPMAITEPQEWTSPIICGAIVDSRGVALAYRVYTDPAVSQAYQDYSSRDLFPAFIPMCPGQLRGPSLLASSVFDWQDIREWKRFEMIAQKTFATRTIVEQNETGDAEGQPKIVPAAFEDTVDTDGNSIKQMSNLAQKPVTAGEYVFLKAGTGSKLEAFDWDRPKDTAQTFNEIMIRDAMRGTEWDAFFSLDPKHVGGAPMRVVVDRVNRTLRKRRRMANKCATRTLTYAIAKAIERGELPFNAEWYKWTHQGPPDITADRRYDAQTDQMEYELGWSTMEDVEKRRNGDWQIKRQQREVEVMDKYERAKRIADKFGISIQEAKNELGFTGNVSSSQSESQQPADGESPNKTGKTAKQQSTTNEGEE